MSEQRKRMGKEKANVTIPTASSLLEMPRSYAELLESIKAQVQRARLKAVLSANAALVMLYWHIGQSILTRQSSEGWGRRK